MHIHRLRWAVSPEFFGMWDAHNMFFVHLRLFVMDIVLTGSYMISNGFSHCDPFPSSAPIKPLRRCRVFGEFGQFFDPSSTDGDEAFSMMRYAIIGKIRTNE